jgi:4-hydroxy 2-oxovalerate aldolase
MTTKFHIMDVTLRDGGYVFNFQYTPELITNIVSCLAESGLEYIEIGHGVSIGAQENNIPTTIGDEEFAKTAYEVKENSKIGMIALPAMATLDQIKKLVPHLDFIRVGINIDAIHNHIDYLKTCKQLGLQVFVQMIRSTALPTTRILNGAKQAESAGVDVIYLVDSAGRFLPDETFDTIEQLTQKIKTPIGFHGHNHLGLANANALAALKAGAQWIDASLLGAGRGAGNVQLEALLIALEKMGLDHGLNTQSLINFAEILVRPLSSEIRGIYRHDLMAARAGVDLYPLDVYQSLARELECELWDIAEAIRQIPNVVEVNPEHIRLVIVRLGKKPKDVFKNLGWTLPEDYS